MRPLLILALPALMFCGLSHADDSPIAQLQEQIKTLQEQQQQQLATLNSQVQAQMQKMHEDLQQEIQTANSQIQDQLKQMQETLQQQITQVQQQIPKAS